MQSSQENRFAPESIDDQAIVYSSGLATVDEAHYLSCHQWLERKGYIFTRLDFRYGITQAVQDLSNFLNWEENFGYSLGENLPNLDALHNGFEFPISEKGRVLEVMRPDLYWEQKPKWFMGMIDTAQQQCRQYLLLGARFFTLLVVHDHSQVIGASLEARRIPSPHRVFR